MYMSSMQVPGGVLGNSGLEIRGQSILQKVGSLARARLTPVGQHHGPCLKHIVPCHCILLGTNEAEVRRLNHGLLWRSKGAFHVHHIARL